MQEHDRWLSIATDDFKAAQALLTLEYFPTAVYHCHQSAEKFLKGYLAFEKQPIIKTHDLVKLIELCRCFDKGFEKLHFAAATLNPYATRFRYPTEFDIPDLQDAQDAIKYAQSIMYFVLKAMKKPVTGQMRI